MSFRQNELLNTSNPENPSTEESHPLPRWFITEVQLISRTIQSGIANCYIMTGTGGRGWKMVTDIRFTCWKKKILMYYLLITDRVVDSSMGFMLTDLLYSVWFSILSFAFCVVCIVERDGLRFLLTWKALHWTGIEHVFCVRFRIL